MEPKDKEGGRGTGSGVDSVDKSAAAEQAAARLPKADFNILVFLLTAVFVMAQSWPNVQKVTFSISTSFATEDEAKEGSVGGGGGGGVGVDVAKQAAAQAQLPKAQSRPFNLLAILLS